MIESIVKKLGKLKYILVAGMLLVVLSLCISLQVLHTKARLWDSLKKKWRERWQR